MFTGLPCPCQTYYPFGMDYLFILENRRRCFQCCSTYSILFMILGLGVALLGCTTARKSMSVRLPSGAVASADIEPAFVYKVDSLVANGEGDAPVVCVVQFDERVLPPQNPDLYPLQDLRGEAWILVGTASTVQVFIGSPDVRWIGEYKPEYKYNHTLAGARVVWVYIETFQGHSPEFRDDMESIGISDIRYIGIPGYYYTRLTGDQVVELASYWWVRNIYRDHRRAFHW